MIPDNRAQRGAQPIPVYRIDAEEAAEAYHAFAALRKAARDDPALIENRYFIALQDTAYARFMMTYEALS